MTMMMMKKKKKKEIREDIIYSVYLRVFISSPNFAFDILFFLLDFYQSSPSLFLLMFIFCAQYMLKFCFLGGWGSTSSNQLHILDGAALPKIVRVSCRTLHTPRFKYGFSATLLSMPDVSPITQVILYIILLSLILFDSTRCSV